MRNLVFNNICMICLLFLSQKVFAEKVTVGILSTSGVQRSMYSSVAREFEKANPDIQVEMLFRSDAEYKEQILQWFNDGSGPDILNWQGGERLYQHVRQGRIANLSTFWQQHDLHDKFSQAAKGAVSLDNDIYAVPVSYYQWGFYYRKSLFDSLGMQAPTDWQSFLAVCEKLKSQGVTPITIGAQYKWPTAAWFDYLNLRLNGLAYHQALLKGEIPFTDSGVRQVFEHWKELLAKGYFVDRYNGWNWQQAMPFMYHKLAGMTLIGNFFAGTLPEVLKDDFRFFPFPIINNEVAVFEEAPLDLFMIPSYAKQNTSAKRFLLYLASKEFQQKFNREVGMIPPNIQSELSNDYFIQQGTKILNEAEGVSQFFDRDTNAELAGAATEIFTVFMDNKDIQAALLALEEARLAAFN